eukprot:TRINITY_DN85865_c0_g1_i1.p2 TRINITY_DN85865_c0_g1~~TRINITY_DN85865_c0_g1_i1.p2  ORF type:complete len:103 (+),score=4.62 TRINITY_DN85865_c0_g1_i1:174-482(+)
MSSVDSSREIHSVSYIFLGHQYSAVRNTTHASTSIVYVLPEATSSLVSSDGTACANASSDNLLEADFTTIYSRRSGEAEITTLHARRAGKPEADVRTPRPVF